MSKFNESILKKLVKETSSLRCAVCTGVFDDPKRLPCGHVFCKICIDSLPKKLCPIDRSEFQIDKIVDDRNMRDIINELEIYCSSKDKGCTWEGEVREMSYHLQETCNYTLFPCKNCSVPIMRISANFHELTCAGSMITCPTCSWKGPRSDSVKHIQDCQFKEVDCELKEFGCNVTVQRCKLQEHLYAPEHMPILIRELKNTKKREEELLQRVITLEEKIKNVTVVNPKMPRTATLGVPTGSLPPAALEILSENVKQINTAIQSGAHMYDLGHFTKCYDIYKSVSDNILTKSKHTPYENAFWCIILQNAVDICTTTIHAQWGKQNDPAWTLRKAFEAIKMGAHKLGCYTAEDCIKFFKRIQDDHGFLKLIPKP